MTEGHVASESVSSEQRGEPVRFSLLPDIKGFVNRKHLFVQSDWSAYIPAEDTKTWRV